MQRKSRFVKNDSEPPELGGSLLKAWDKAGRRQRSRMLAILIESLSHKHRIAAGPNNLAIEKPAALAQDTKKEGGNSTLASRPKGDGSMDTSRKNFRRGRILSLSVANPPETETDTPEKFKPYEAIASSSCTALWASLRGGGALASLFLSRVLSNSRVCFLTGAAVFLHFQLIALLIREEGNGNLLVEFAEGGGVGLVVEVLTSYCKQQSQEKEGDPDARPLRSLEQDWRHGFELLKEVSNTGGRSYKEFLCQRGVAGSAVSALSCTQDPKTADAGRDLLVALGCGNPVSAATVREGLLVLLGTLTNPLAQQTALQVATMLFSHDSTYYTPSPSCEAVAESSAGGGGSTQNTSPHDLLTFVPATLAMLYYAKDRCLLQACLEFCVLLASQHTEVQTAAIEGLVQILKKGIAECVTGKRDRPNSRREDNASKKRQIIKRPKTPDFIKMSATQQADENPKLVAKKSDENPEVLVCQLFSMIGRDAGPTASHAMCTFEVPRFLCLSLIATFQLEPFLEAERPFSTLADLPPQETANDLQKAEKKSKRASALWKKVQYSVLGPPAQNDHVTARGLSLQAAAANTLRDLYLDVPPTDKGMRESTEHSIQAYLKYVLQDNLQLLEALINNADEFLSDFSGEIDAAMALQRRVWELNTSANNKSKEQPHHLYLTEESQSTLRRPEVEAAKLSTPRTFVTDLQDIEGAQPEEDLGVTSAISSIAKPQSLQYTVNLMDTGLSSKMDEFLNEQGWSPMKTNKAAEGTLGFPTHQQPHGGGGRRQAALSKRPGFTDEVHLVERVALQARLQPSEEERPDAGTTAWDVRQLINGVIERSTGEERKLQNAKPNQDEMHKPRSAPSGRRQPTFQIQRRKLKSATSTPRKRLEGTKPKIKSPHMSRWGSYEGPTDGYARKISLSNSQEKMLMYRPSSPIQNTHSTRGNNCANTFFGTPIRRTKAGVPSIISSPISEALPELHGNRVNPAQIQLADGYALPKSFVFK